MPTEKQVLDRKRRGVCVNCAAHAPLPNRSWCAVCADKDRARKQKNREYTITCVRVAMKKLRHYRMDNRLCVDCGIPLSDDNPGRSCEAHAMRRHEYKKHARVFTDRFARTPGNAAAILEHWKETPRVFLDYLGKEKKQCV